MLVFISHSEHARWRAWEVCIVHGVDTSRIAFQKTPNPGDGWMTDADVPVEARAALGEIQGITVLEEEAA